jgi:formylglycine-generating enzyme required for sulfatase activity
MGIGIEDAMMNKRKLTRRGRAAGPVTMRPGAALSSITLLFAGLLFAACGQAADPRDTSYEIKTAEKYRSMAAAVGSGKTASVSGEGSGGVFKAGKESVLMAYSIARYETTWELWKEVYDWAQGHGYSIANEGTEGHGGEGGTGGTSWAAAMKKTRPVTGVTWRDAVVWCNAYSELSGLEPVYYTADGLSVLRESDTDDGTDEGLAMMKTDKNGFRLPLETEWKYAARGASPDGADWEFVYSGGGEPGDVAWYDDNAAVTGTPAYGAHPAGTKKANRLGLYDMSGNAAEWCWDSYNEAIDQGSGGPVSGSLRVVRGGSWNSEDAFCMVENREFQDPFYRDNTVGFRVARAIPDNGDDEGYVEEDEPIEPLPPFTGLAGTKWLWGQSLLEFTESAAIFREDASQPYTYTVTSMTDGEAGRGAITTLGDFTVNAERSVLEILDYRKGGVAIDNRKIYEEKVYNAVFMRRDPAVLTQEYMTALSTSTLVGTEWDVGGGADGARNQSTQWIVFFTKTIAVNRSANFTNIDDYTFNKTRMRGWIYFINDFILKNWDNLYIPVYKQYGHDMNCYRVR